MKVQRRSVLEEPDLREGCLCAEGVGARVPHLVSPGGAPLGYLPNPYTAPSMHRLVCLFVLDSDLKV